MGKKADTSHDHTVGSKVTDSRHIDIAHEVGKERAHLFKRYSKNIDAAARSGNLNVDHRESSTRKVEPSKAVYQTLEARGLISHNPKIHEMDPMARAKHTKETKDLMDAISKNDGITKRNDEFSP